MQSTGVYWMARHPGNGGFGSVPGEWAGHEEPAGTQKRCAGEPMADEAAPLWTIAQFLPALSGGTHDAHLLAAAQRSGTVSRATPPADAEDADADEYPVGERLERSPRSNG